MIFFAGHRYTTYPQSSNERVMIIIQSLLISTLLLMAFPIRMNMIKIVYKYNNMNSIN